jgi:hypothetical protein
VFYGEKIHIVFIRVAIGFEPQKVKNQGSGRHVMTPANHPKHDPNCNSHEKGKVFHAPKKTKPLPTGIGCHILCTREKKKKKKKN